MPAIMIIDDHAVLRDGLKTIFSMEDDFTVVAEAETAKEALEKLTGIIPDVIIMDINLPGENGVDLTKRIKEKYKGIKVLILTMHKHEEYFMAAIRNGADGYVLKDAPSEEVVTAVRTLMTGEAVIPSSMTRTLLTMHQQPEQEKADKELTEREKEVLDCLVKGLSNKEVAEELLISDKTVKIHVSNIFKKLGVKSRSQAVIHAIQHQLVSIPE
ncbi:response regulator [Alteribacter keqinensis]|uniref:DNA-binding response regulator n=1 Tax=Alteribacter keqinensis TaxID=2483800 RepID=A0A3M7TLE8_9BACI|nr:response regulator transcription factor [Alteribacter keqinensis]RNA66298.1 DNA-binding response regulator [Alteribacter keqinensis]